MSTPVIYLPHGGGPWPWLGEGYFGGPAAWAGLRTFLEGLPASLPTPPRAVLMVTAHWEAPVATVSSSARPPMLYDYGGFPPETYRVVWPAPGAPDLAARVRSLLAAAGLPSAEDPARGFDHGTFVPMAVAWPAADVPTVQLSLVRGLDPDTHLRIGRALRPLRDEGVLIAGSGMSYHDMRGFFTASGAAASEVFDAWLRETVARPGPERDAALRAWASAPAARACHPREEHLLPLMVVAGAAGDGPGFIPYSERVLGVRVSAARWD
jgi:aromatic ring-opening dioxygenase catalytic subunit (LigB family)